MAIDLQVGPYTQAQLLELWISLVDPLYAQPLLLQGDGQGLEAFSQQQAQGVRTSQAIDRTTQGMFILPWSGQSDVPAEGGARARVDLTMRRTVTSLPLAITFNLAIRFEEETTDYSDAGPLVVRTERRYLPSQLVTFGPGDVGPITVPAIAEAEGYGYNNPLPGTIKAFAQVGAGFSNVRATISPGPTAHRLIVQPNPDVVLPQHVGQYVKLIGGANNGQIRRIIGYEKPTPGNGGVAVLAKTAVLQIAGTVGTFIPGESLTIGAGLVAAKFIYISATHAVIEEVNGVIAPADVITGVSSSATTVISSIDLSPDMTPELNTATWLILDFEKDLGFSVTNELSPTGGQLPMLDELGAERNIGRSPGEADDAYRKRIATLPDTVSPNAIRRAVNRVLAPMGSAVCLREVGLELFRGMFYDGDPLNLDRRVAFAFDLASVLVGGVIVGSFFEGERVKQVHGSGAISIGRALIDHSTGIFMGIDVGEGTFVAVPAELIVGERSGATIAPAVVTGGLSPFDRFRLNLDYLEFRAFFLLGVPPLGIDEFGIAYDAGPHNAFDASPFLAFTDGFPVGAAITYRAIWQDIDKRRAGGVGFDLVVETLGCF
jgi:hypothetical protein